MAAWVVTEVKVEETAVKVVRVARALTRNWDSRRSDRKFLCTRHNLMPTCGTNRCYPHRNRRNQRQICSTRRRPRGVKEMGV